MGIDLVALGERTPEEYAFDAQSLSDALNQMRRKGPEGNFGRCSIEVKFQSFEVSVGVTEGASGPYRASAVLSKGTILYEILYRVPRWRNIESLPLPIQAEWDRFMRCLWIHERGHPPVEISVLETYVRRFEELRCVETGREARAAAEAAHREIGNQRDALIEEIRLRREEARHRYDLETHHGETQGVYLNLDIDRMLQGSSRH